MAGMQYRNLETGRQGSWQNAAYWLAHPASSAFSWNPGPLGQGQITHSDLGPPPSNKSQDSTPCTCPQANLMEMLSQLRVPLPKCVYVCVKLTKQ